MARSAHGADHAPTDSEREPLLNADRHGSIDEAIATPKSPIESLRLQLTENWAVWRVVIVVFFLYVIAVGPGSELYEVSRAVACARFYEQNPQELPTDRGLFATRADPAEMCDLDVIEQRSNFQTTTIDVISALSAVLSMLLFGPRLRQWGCKRVLMATMALYAIPLVTYISIPRGFPYGPRAGKMPISPSNISRIFIANSIIGGLAGQVMVPMCCLRLLMTDASTVSTKSANMQRLIFALLLGTTVGPGFFAFVGSSFPIYVDEVLTAFASLGSFIQAAATQAISLPTLPQPTEPLPVPPKIGEDSHSNVTVFVLGLVILATSLVFIMISFPDDRSAQQSTDEVVEEMANNSTPSKMNEKGRSSLVSHLIPKRSKDGTRDWRILTIFTVAFLHTNANYVLTIYVQYFGHAMHWGADWVGYLISYLGGARLVAVLVLVPSLLAYFERTVRRPRLLRHMSMEQLKAHGSHARADEAPTGTDASAFASNIVAEEQDVDEHAVDGAVAMWRARIDRSLLKTSWGLDVLGWVLVALATVSGNTAANLLGGFFAAFGAGAMGARLSVDLTIVGDVFAHEQSSSDGDDDETMETAAAAASLSPADSPSQVYFSLLTIAEGCANLLAPIFASAVYQSTLSSFPAANWLLASFYYFACIVLHFSMPVHK